MKSDPDQKAYWNLLETVRWICTRDEERVAAMWDMDEDEQMAVTMFDPKPEHTLSLIARMASHKRIANRPASPRFLWGLTKPWTIYSANCAAVAFR
jgi:hypothetical protein